MANAAASADVRTCGNCQDWRETKTQCPGMGFCGNAAASHFKTGPDRLSLTSRFMASNQVCPMGMK